MEYIYLLLAVILNTSSNIIFKGISGKRNDLLWFAIFAAGLILGAINVYFFTKSLKDIDLGIAYPIFSAACIALTILASVFIFHEKLSLVNMAGVVVIIFGIVLLTR
jgi:small multidrug resistance pump